MIATIRMSVGSKYRLYTWGHPLLFWAKLGLHRSTIITYNVVNRSYDSVPCSISIQLDTRTQSVRERFFIMWSKNHVTNGCAIENIQDSKPQIRRVFMDSVCATSLTVHRYFCANIYFRNVSFLSVFSSWFTWNWM